MTVLATNLLFTFASGANIQNVSPRSKIRHQYLKIVANLTSRSLSQYHFSHFDYFFISQDDMSRYCYNGICGCNTNSGWRKDRLNSQSFYLLTWILIVMNHRIWFITYDEMGYVSLKRQLERTRSWKLFSWRVCSWIDYFQLRSYKLFKIVYFTIWSYLIIYFIL